MKQISREEVIQNMRDFEDKWDTDKWGGLTAHIHRRDIYEVSILKDQIDEWMLVGYDEPN